MISTEPPTPPQQTKTRILHPFFAFLIGSIAITTTGYLVLWHALDMKDRYGHALDVAERYRRAPIYDPFPIGDALILILLEIVATVVAIIVLWGYRRRMRHGN